MPGFTDAAKNRMLSHLAGKAVVGDPIDQISLHSSEPDMSGSNEVSGGGYTRQSVAGADFDLDDGELVLNDDLLFNGGASSNATYMGIWADGAFMGAGAITGDTTFNSEGELILKQGTRILIE